MTEKNKKMHLTRGANMARQMAELEIGIGNIVVEKISKKLVRGELYQGGDRVADVVLSHLYGGTWEVELYGNSWFDQKVYGMTDRVTVTGGFLNTCDIKNEQGDYLFFRKNGMVAVG
jgi:hypothetical protein